MATAVSTLLLVRCSRRFEIWTIVFVIVWLKWANDKFYKVIELYCWILADMSNNSEIKLMNIVKMQAWLSILADSERSATLCNWNFLKLALNLQEYFDTTVEYLDNLIIICWRCLRLRRKLEIRIRSIIEFGNAACIIAHTLFAFYMSCYSLSRAWIKEINSSK